MATKAQFPSLPLSFEIFGSQIDGKNARLGKLSFPERTAIHTPHYLALSSRGVVPHLSQDMMRDHSDIKGIYASLEDCKYDTPGPAYL